MSHVYVVQSAQRIGDLIQVIGTVDGFPVSVSVWFSAVASLPNTTAVQNFIAPIMLAQAIASGSVTQTTTAVPSVTAAGTFTQ